MVKRFLPFAGYSVNGEWKDQNKSGYYLIKGSSYFNFWPNGATKTNRDSDLINRFYQVRMILKKNHLFESLNNSFNLVN